MKKLQRKLTGGIVLCGCTLFGLYGISCIADKADDMAVPVSLTGISNDKPVIVLDAGHGESI